MLKNLLNHCKNFIFLWSLTMLVCCKMLSATPALAIVCAAPGSNGPSDLSGSLINTYYPGRNSASAGSTSISVGSIDGRGSLTPVAAGDLLLIIQMQDASINNSNSSSYGGSSPGQGYSSLNSAGAYEYAVAAGPISAGTLTVTSGLLNTYTQASAGFSQGQRTFQVLRVPQYSSARIVGLVSAPPWNGASGGVVAIDVAGQLNWNSGTIDVSGRGFRGGAAQRSGSNGTGDVLTNTDYVSRVGAGTLTLTATSGSVPNGAKGEGIAGTPIIVYVPATPNNDNVAGTATNTGGTDGVSGGYPGGSFGRGAPGNAGGGGSDGNPPANDQNTGGGGGGNYGSGGTGGFGWTPGTPPGSQTGGFGGGSVPNTPARLFMGGGGGAGSTNDGTFPVNGTGINTSGASGGGIVLVRTGTVTGNGTINANGANSNIQANPPTFPPTAGIQNDASGGGGAGGSVLVLVDNGGGPTNVTININGGKGGDNAPGNCTGTNDPHGPGGGGSGGYAVLSSNPAAIFYAGGTNGTTCSSPTTTNEYGSTTSPGGFSLVNLIPTQIPGAGASPICYPRITVAKSTSTPNVNQGGVATYTITATNESGYGTASGVVITDTLPGSPNITLAATTSVTMAGGATRTPAPNPSAGATSPSWSGFSIPGGGSVTITFTVNIAAATPQATYQNPARVDYNDPTATVAGQTVTPGGTYASGGTVLGSNYVPASSTGEDVTVRSPATFSKSFSPSSTAIGGTSVLTVTVGNPAGISLTNAAFSDSYPAGLVNAAVPAASTTCSGGTVTAAPGGTSFSLSGATIPPGGCQVQVTVTAPVSGPFTNTIPAAALSDSENVTNTVAVSATLLGRPTITKTFSPIAVAQNTNATLTFTVANPNSAGLTGISFSDTYPAGLVNATPLTVGGSCGGVTVNAATVAGGGQFNVTGGTVAASGNCTITVLVRSAVAGNYPNSSAGVTSTQTPDAGLPSNTAALGVGLIAVNKVFAPARIAPGGTSTVTLTLANPTGIAQTGGSLTDTLTNMSISGNQTAGGTCGAFAGNSLINGQTSLVFSGINIPAAGCSITFVVTSGTTGSNLNTTSGVSTALLPVGPVSNSATLTVVQKPTISKNFVPASIQPGGTTTMVLTITNPDSIPLTGINFTDSYPVNLVNAAPLAVGGSCLGTTVSGATTAGGSVFNVTSATVPALSSCTITVPVTSAVSGTYNNATSGVASTESGTAGTASNTAALNVLLPPAITAKAFSPALISQNGVSTMTFTLQNGNAVALTGVRFSDALTNMTVANGAIGGTCAGTVNSPALVAGATALNLTVPSISAGSSCTVTIQVTSNVSGANTNQTSGASSNETPLAGSPSPVATLNVLRPPQLAKNFVPGQINVGGTTTLTFSITNPNTTTALTNVQFSDILSSMSVASTGFSETCSGNVTFSPALSVGGTQVNPALTTLAANETCTISVSITSGTISPLAGHNNTTSGATSTETPLAGNGATTTLDVLGPATIAKVFNAASIQTSGTATITFTLTNPNASAMTGAAFSDTFPTGMTTVAAAQVFTGGGRGTCTGSIPNSKAAGVTTGVTFAGINIPANGSCTVMVDVTAVGAGSYVNTVSGVTTFQVPTAGPGASATLAVLAAPTVSKSYLQSTIANGASTTLTLTITNPNAVPLTGVAISDTYPAFHRNLNTTVTNTCGGTATASPFATVPGTLTLTGGNLAANGSCSISVAVTSTTNGLVTNTTSGVTTDQTPIAGATASDTLTVVTAGGSRLAYTKAFSQPRVQAGPGAGALNMIFTINNLSATLAAQDIRFNAVDTMPTAGGQQMTLVNGTNPCTITAAAPAGSCGFNGVTAIGTVVPNAAVSTTTLNFSQTGTGLRLAAASSCTVTCPVTIPAATTGGTYTNTATFLVTGTGGFTTTSGDTASVVALKPPTISKTFAPAVIGAGSSSTLTFTLTNTATGTVAYSNATFTDTLTNMSISGNQTAGGSCGGASGNSFTAGQTGLISLSGLTIPAGGSCTVTLEVTSTTVGANANTTSGVTSTETPTAGTGAASVNLAVRGSTLTKAFAPATVLTGVSSTLTFTITNGAGNPAQSGLAFTETLPANLVVANPANVSTTCGGGTVTAGSGSGTISLSNGSMSLAQASCIVEADVVSAVAGTYTNVAANVNGTSPGMTNSVNASLTVNGHPTLTKAFTPATIGFNGTSALSFTVANSAGNPAQSQLGFTDTLPAGMLVATPNGLVNGCGGAVTATAGSNSISLANGTLVAGTPACTITVNATATAAGTYQNTAIGNISGLSGGLTANGLSSTLTVVGTTLSKSFSPATQMLGSNSRLTLTISNGSGNPAQSGLAFTDNLPAGLVVATPSGLVNGCGGVPTVTTGSGTITLSGGTLAAGAASCSIAVDVIAGSVGVYTNNAARISGTSSNIDASTVNASVTYLATAGITKAFSPNAIITDALSTITFSLVNANPIALTNAAFSDTLSGMVINANQSAGGTCGGVAGNSFTAGQTVLAFSGLSIPPGGCTVTVVVTTDIPGNYNNTTSGVTTEQTPIGTVSNTAQLTVTAAAPGIAKAFAPATINQGATSTITFTLGNTNGINLTSAGFSDSLVNMTVSGAQAASGSCAGAGGNSFVNGQTALVFSGLTIPANGSCTVTVVVTSSTFGTLTNQATGVSSAQASTGAASNVASLVVQLVLPSLTFVKQATPATAGPGQVISYTLLTTNSGLGAATAVLLSDALSSYTMWGVDSFAANTPFLLTQGTPASGLTLGTPAYSNDGGVTWTYIPSSGAGGAPAGFDGNVTNWRIPMAGSMSGNGANFTLQYRVQVR